MNEIGKNYIYITEFGTITLSGPEPTFRLFQNGEE